MRICFLLVFLLMSIEGCNPIKNANVELKEPKYFINNTPVDIVKTYWETSSNKSGAFEGIITKTPISYWHQCENTNNLNSEPFDDSSPLEEWEEGFFSLTVSTKNYIDVNQMKIAAIDEERSIGNEATVLVDSNNNFTKQTMRFYLTKDTGNWKIFLVDSDISENPNLFYFAEPRPECN